MTTSSHETLETRVPVHWEAPQVKKHQISTYAHFYFFHVLCLLSVGHRTLERTHANATCGPIIWEESRARLYSRLANTSVVAGLLLATTAVFITTAPPNRPILDYMALGPYACILLSFGLSLGSLIVGSAVMFVISACDAAWFLNTLTKTRSRLYCTLFAISYPYISVGVSAGVCAVGLVVAAQLSEARLVSIGSIFVLLIPVGVLPIFIWAVV